MVLITLCDESAHRPANTVVVICETQYGRAHRTGIYSSQLYSTAPATHHPPAHHHSPDTTAHRHRALPVPLATGHRPRRQAPRRAPAAALPDETAHRPSRSRTQCPAPGSPIPHQQQSTHNRLKSHIFRASRALSSFVILIECIDHTSGKDLVNVMVTISGGPPDGISSPEKAAGPKRKGPKAGAAHMNGNERWARCAPSHLSAISSHSRPSYRPSSA